MTTTIRHFISAAAFVTFIILALASSDNAKTEQDISSSPSSQAIQIGAHQLYQDYEANEVAADQKYKDNVLLVTGTVATIGKDITDEIYVALVGDDSGFGQVQCMMGANHTNEAAQLKKGMRVTIKGKCDGKMMNILLSGCSLQ